jgi:hypothetical protein
MAYWLDHRGALIGPAPLDDPTGWEKYADVTHRIMRPQPGQLIQAVSWCGRRVHEVPGRGSVGCRECLQLMAEEFEAAYAARSGVTVRQLHAWGRYAERCDCGDPECEGWAMGHQWEDALAADQLLSRLRSDNTNCRESEGH